MGGRAAHEFEFDFGEGEYRAMVGLRDARTLRASGLAVAALLSPFALMLPWALAEGDAGDVLAAVALAATAAAFLALGVRGRAPWIAAVRAPQARAYLERHGAAGGQGAFRQRVALSEEGVELSYRPLSADPSDAMVFRVPWSAWRAARSGREGLLVECREGRRGGLGALLGYNALLRVATRDRLRDAFVPASALGGADARELARWANGRIRAAR